MFRTDTALANEYFQMKRHGEIAVIIPSPEVEQLPESLLQPAAQMLLQPLRNDPPSHLIVDLAGVRYCGSAFLTFLLRCREVAEQQGSELAVSGVTTRVRELLRVTAIDQICSLYETRQEALLALGSLD
jgi:anti-sigma B factor antagonist